MLVANFLLGQLFQHALPPNHNVAPPQEDLRRLLLAAPHMEEGLSQSALAFVSSGRCAAAVAKWA
jgi:hypothetical protein